MVARGGNHVTKKLSIRVGSDEPGVGFGEEKGDGRGVRGKRDGRFVCTGCCRAKNGKTGGGDIVSPEDFDGVWKWGNFGRNPGFALGLFDDEVEFPQGVNPK